MLKSQISAIFADFRRKNWRFSHANIFANFFGENVFKNHNIGPRVTRLGELVPIG
jgi:hypothetical protein